MRYEARTFIERNPLDALVRIVALHELGREFR
jgi:hypothetical protein